MPTPPTGRPNAWPGPTIPPLCFDFNSTLATPQLCIFTVQTQFEISWVVDRPQKQAISLPSRIVYKSHFLQPKPPPRLTGGFCTKFRNTRPPRRPAQILRHSGFTTLHNSDDFRSFFPFWAEYPACKIGFPASRNWLNDKHSAGTSMSTSLHVLKKFWHQVNIRPAGRCFDWFSVISVTAAGHGVNLVVTSCTRGL